MRATAKCCCKSIRFNCNNALIKWKICTLLDAINKADECQLRVKLHTISRNLRRAIKGTHVADAFNYAHFHPIIFRCRCSEIESHFDAQRLNSWAIIMFIWCCLPFALLSANEMHCLLEWLAFRSVFKLFSTSRTHHITTNREPELCIVLHCILAVSDYL